jgi:hypothetical protein
MEVLFYISPGEILDDVGENQDYIDPNISAIKVLIFC